MLLVKGDGGGGGGGLVVLIRIRFMVAPRARKKFEIQLPSTFQFSVAPTKILLFFVTILNLPCALLLVPDFYFLYIIQYGGQYGDRRTKRKQGLLGF